MQGEGGEMNMMHEWWICMLTEKNLFTFISGKHSQHDGRKCADRLNSEGKFWKTLASEQTGKILLWPR